MRALRQFVAQVRHRNVRVVPFEQPVNPKPALLAAR